MLDNRKLDSAFSQDKILTGVEPQPHLQTLVLLSEEFSLLTYQYPAFAQFAAIRYQRSHILSHVNKTYGSTLVAVARR
jgi:hypothetical protein